MTKSTLFSLILIGGLGLYWFVGQQIQPMPHNVTAVTEQVEEQSPLFYRNPNNADMTSPVPTKNDMGMDYVPVYPKNSPATEIMSPGTVKVDLTTDGLTQTIKDVNDGAEVNTSHHFLVDSESQPDDATAKVIEALKADTHTQLESSSEPKTKTNDTFSIGIPEQPKNMRVTPSKNNPTMDVRKRD